MTEIKTDFGFADFLRTEKDKSVNMRANISMALLNSNKEVIKDNVKTYTLIRFLKQDANLKEGTIERATNKVLYPILYDMAKTFIDVANLPKDILERKEAEYLKEAHEKIQSATD